MRQEKNDARLAAGLEYARAHGTKSGNPVGRPHRVFDHKLVADLHGEQLAPETRARPKALRNQRGSLRSEQLANVISDLSGVTGQAIVPAILSGERDGRKLAGLRDGRIKATEEEMAQSGGELARRSAIYPEAGTGGLRLLPKADRRLRSATEAILGAV